MGVSKFVLVVVTSLVGILGLVAAALAWCALRPVVLGPIIILNLLIGLDVIRCCFWLAPSSIGLAIILISS